MAVEFLHTLDGRLRLKVRAVRGSVDSARAIEASLLEVGGIEQVTANPTTGTVLIHYDPATIDEREVVRTLKNVLGVQRVRPVRKHADAVRPAVNHASGIGHRVADNVMTVLLEMLFRRLLV